MKVDSVVIDKYSRPDNAVSFGRTRICCGAKEKNL